MIRALYTAASGMNAQQANIDNVAHNLANVNTTGFKKSRVEFEDLVYQQIRAPGTPTSQETEAPVGLEAGLGSRPVAIARNFSAGNLRATQGPLDLAIEGAGLLPGHAARRRDRLHARRHAAPERPGPDRHHRRLSDRAGHHDSGERRLGHRSRRTASSRCSCPDQDAPQQVGTIELANFQNPAGLQARGGNIFVATTASGDPQTGVPGTDGLGTLAQGFIEDSNVSVVEEMVNMILGQRAYEANSKVIRAADEMLQQVNNLPR